MFQVSQSQESPLPSSSPAKMRRLETVWPPFHNKGSTFPTEFDGGLWKCPLCSLRRQRIWQHLTTHKDLIDDWTAAKIYCKEVALLKERERDKKRTEDPKRKEVVRKADKKREPKRAEDPKRKEVIKKADKKREPKRADDPNRKEVKRKADEKRADDPKRKETMREAQRRYAQTLHGKWSKYLAQEKYRENLGITRRMAQYRKYQQTKIDKARGGDAVMRRIKFQKGVLRGPEYVCSCCHRSLYKKSVTSVTEKMKEKIRMASEEKMRKATEEKSKVAAASSEEIVISSEHQTTHQSNSRDKSKAEAATSEDINISSEHQTTNKSITEDRKSKLKKKSKKIFSFQADAYKAWNHHLLTSVDDLAFLCSTCKSSLQKGNIPAMAVANGLQLNHPDRPILTELESSLIAHNINFQKIVLLPKSRMAAGKGRMISIPVGPADIMNTVKQLPRLPNEAGLVPIKLKRKKEYKSHEKQEEIRPEQIFLALRYLRKAGNPFYQFYDDKETYLARCRIKDQRGLRLFQDDKDDIEEDLGMPTTPDMAEVEDQAVRDADDDGEDELEIAMEEEEEDIQNDPVRRQHFNYNEYSTLVNGHPDIFLDSEGNQMANLDFAPGEGKRPVNFLDQKHWDVKTWPTLLPDGKFGLSHERTVKLTRQNYFQQRLLNVDDRFAKTPGFLFGAMSVVEAERLRANANLTGMKGKRNVGAGGHVTYQLEDPCTVFEKIKGTPKYWQRARYEIIAKLENIGPFQVKNNRLPIASTS